MTNKPVRSVTLPPLHTDAGHFLAALLDAGERAGRITPEQRSRIRRDMERMLTDLAVRYTFGASSSMPAEKAQALLASAVYCIGIALKRLPSADTALEYLLGSTPDALRREGLSGIDDLTRRSKERLLALQASPVTNNRAWLDTIRHGLPLFFSSYDAVYAAHETPGSIDYPLCVDINRLSGIEYIGVYIKKLCIEAAFCSRWPHTDIDALLRGHSPGWRELLINVFERTLTNALGCALCGRDVSRLVLIADDRTYLATKLGGLSAGRLRAMLGVSLGRLGLDDAADRYAKAALPEIVSSVISALTSRHLETVFVTPALPQMPTVCYTDGPRLDDEAFRALTEAVRECRHMSDKQALIRRHIRSLSDLADLLGASCLFDDEYAALFAGLDAPTLGQLTAMIPADPFHATAAEQEWHAALTAFNAT
jgi:hypothetical protein